MQAAVIAGTHANGRWIPYHDIDPAAKKELDLMGESLVVLAEVLVMLAEGNYGDKTRVAMATLKDAVVYLAEAAYQLGYRKGQDDGAHRGE